jgi:hypothetical protein
LLLGTRPEEQDVGPKATDIMSGVFEVFVNLTQVFAGDPKLSYLFRVKREAEFTPVRSRNFSNVH